MSSEGGRCADEIRWTALNMIFLSSVHPLYNNLVMVGAYVRQSVFGTSEDPNILISVHGVTEI